MSAKNPFDSIPFMRALLGIAAIAALLPWGGWRVDQARQRKAGREFLDTRAPLEIQDYSLPSPSVELLSLQSLICEQNLFPPDYKKAEALTTQAIGRQPLSSVLWMNLARIQFFQGKKELARASLTRCGELDPNYPLQQLEAIRLWGLLNEPARAHFLALRLGKRGGIFRRGVVQEMMNLGYRPGRIFDILDLARADPAEIASLLGFLYRNDAGMMEELYSRIPDRCYENETFEMSALPFIRRPLLKPILAKIWKAHSPGKVVLSCDKDGLSTLMLENVDLEAPAFSQPFEYGWQPPPETPWASISWAPPREEGLAEGRIHLEFHNSTEMRKDGFNWTYYRFLAAPAKGLAVSQALDISPSAPSAFQLRVIVGRSASYFSSRTPKEANAPHLLEATIPPQAKWTEIELVLMRELREEEGVFAKQVNVTMRPPVFRSGAAKPKAAEPALAGKP